jgi:hypothetical protein
LNRAESEKKSGERRAESGERERERERERRKRAEKLRRMKAYS